MSAFIDKLKKLTHGESSSIGFRREQSASSSRKIQMVSIVSGSDNESSGADAVLVDASVKEVTVEFSKKLPEGIPWGLWLKAGGKKEIKQLKETGCDFIVFPAANTSLDIIEDKDIGKILEIDTSVSDSVLRSVVELSVEAVLVSTGQDGAGVLTWQDLMILQRFGGIPNKPLLACVPSKVTGSELEALWEAGVMAIVAEGNIGKLRKVIDSADFTQIRKREKAEPVLKQPETE